MDKAAFLDLLKSLTEQAAINDNSISKEEIDEAFEGEDITKEQLKLVYDYLDQNNVKVEGYKKRGSKAKAKQDEGEPLDDEKIPDSPILKMYLSSLKEHKKLTAEEEAELLLKLLENEESFLLEKESFINHKLHYVVSRARRLAKGGETLEELIQEGNIGLLTALDRIKDNLWELSANITEAEKMIEDGIESAMKAYIDEIYENESEEKAMVAKVNFVSEAAKQLKEENGVEPNLAELAKYTNMDEEELMGIINLSADTLKADKQ